MNNDFPRIITFLRKERGLSQKKVAEDLGISQALLSHYEKGIRECGLDFLIKVSDYYDVSTDYLLGKTVQRNSNAINADDIPDGDDVHHLKGSMINQINRKIVMNSTTVIYDLLAQMGNKHLTNAVSSYIMCSEYQIFRMLYNAEKSNSQTLFALNKNQYRNLTSASMMMLLEQSQTILENEKLSLALSPDILSSYFGKGAASLFNLIQFSERNVRNHIND